MGSDMDPKSLKVDYVPRSSLKRSRRNARKHSRRQIRQIAQSIKAFGFNVPILTDGAGNIVAGHGRYEAAEFDDGGFSGGDIDRPALQRLLESVRAGKIDVIVVNKVDRLTRSLADFAKLVELFDQHNVSFVSLTQQFNTTTSMGRLTLNVLLSFAQFEREVTAERIRDKISASKRKGLWVGGMAPLGYDTKNRKITLNEAEAERVRDIFRSYLRLGSLNLLMTDLRERGIVTKVRTLKTGEAVGGIPFTRGPLAHLLRNRFYIGEVAFKGEILNGEQPPVIERDLFDAVQAKLKEQQNNHKAGRTQSEALLIGRIFDDHDNRMSPNSCAQAPC